MCTAHCQICLNIKVMNYYKSQDKINGETKFSNTLIEMRMTRTSQNSWLELQ